MRRAIAQVFSYNLITKVFSAFATIMIIRLMSSEEYAKYTITIAVSSIIIETLGSAFNRIYIVGHERLNLSMNNGPFLWLQFFLITVILVSIYPLLSIGNLLYFALVIMVLAICIFQFLKSIYQRELRFNRFSQVELSKSILFAVFLTSAIFFFKSGIKAWQVISLQAIAILLVAFPLFLKKEKLQGIFSIGTGIHMAKKIFMSEYRYLFAYLFVLSFFSRVDIFMLKSLSNDFDLATYSSAFRYYSIVLMSLSAVKIVLLPLVQKVDSKENLKLIYKKHYSLVLIFIPVILSGAWFSKWLIPWIDGGKYPGAIIVFQILAISSIFSFVFSPYVDFIMRFEKFIFLFVIISIAFIVNLLLNNIFIPSFGPSGAALSTLIAFGISNGAVFLYAQRLLMILPENMSLNLKYRNFHF